MYLRLVSICYNIIKRKGKAKMKVVILAGGYGTRLSEETHSLPKPMVTIGGMPILWHIMKYYSAFGFNEFVICLGYKGFAIKEYFYSYWLRQSDVTIKNSDTGADIKIHKSSTEDWEVTLADTGIDVQTGLRIKKIQPYRKYFTICRKWELRTTRK